MKTKKQNKKEEQRVIVKVWIHNYTKQKFVTIPKDCDIKKGDYVEVKKI
jgi:hypothetical protein